MLDLSVLQAVRLKGRTTVSDIAATIGQEPTTVGSTVESLVESGLLIEGNTVRLTSEGRARLNELLAHEWADVDKAALIATYDEFRSVNTDFKALVSDWQLRDGRPNAHDDLDYDDEVLRRLDGIHERVLPILADASRQIPRLSAYSTKLVNAVGKVRNGETSWLTRPIIDSYHTVWFELHEELILAAGLTREDEARAGHAG